MSDLISRQAAIEAICDLPNCNNGYSDTYDKSLIIGVIEELPSAEPKKGKWIEKDVIHKDEAQDVIEEWQSAKCSVCGKYHTTPYMYYFDEYKYCPNCGERMVEEVHSMHGKADIDPETFMAIYNDTEDEDDGI